jgi:hypothetical protein
MLHFVLLINRLAYTIYLIVYSKNQLFLPLVTFSPPIINSYIKNGVNHYLQHYKMAFYIIFMQKLRAGHVDFYNRHKSMCIHVWWREIDINAFNMA